jgi:hypothetical protein
MKMKVTKWMILCLSILQKCTWVLCSCPNLCNDRGTCDKYSRCTCNEGFQGADCSEYICPYGIAWSDQAIRTDVAHQLSECSNRGICNRLDGTCKCMTGYTGTACERLECTSNCNGVGICSSLLKKSEDTRDRFSRSFRYDQGWDAMKIQGCVCDPAYTGYDCSQWVCPTGDDPLTINQLNEIQLIKCIATTGTFVLFHRGQPSSTIRWDASILEMKEALEKIPSIGKVKISFSLSSVSTVCQSSVNIISIEFLDRFGNHEPLVAEMDTNMILSGGTISISADGVSCFEDDEHHILKSIKGTKENDACSNRGYCNHNDGLCYCYDSNGDKYASSNGYGSVGLRGDCGYAISGAIATCPGELQCSGHGNCITNEGSFRCECSEGWTSGDCSERLCPSGLSWFSYPSANNVAHDIYTTCSDMGNCNTDTGQCICHPAFYGQACEYMACGGGIDSPCNGHGRCLTMYELAEWAENNGDATEYTYGLDPNNPLTWDAHRVHGCLCDKGWDGYDCSLRKCPQGNDPGTYDDTVEIQIIECIADGGTFRLGFRQQWTTELSADSTILDVENALISMVGSPLSLTFALTNRTIRSMMQKQFCQNISSIFSTMILRFNTTHGNLPSLLIDTSKLRDDTNGDGRMGSGHIHLAVDGQILNTVKSYRGTTENAYCNNRGLCDFTKGICHCFMYWASSDGQGNVGDLGDCGYRNQFNTNGGRLPIPMVENKFGVLNPMEIEEQKKAKSILDILDPQEKTKLENILDHKLNAD